MYGLVAGKKEEPQQDRRQNYMCWEQQPSNKGQHQSGVIPAGVPVKHDGYKAESRVEHRAEPQVCTMRG